MNKKIAWEKYYHPLFNEEEPEDKFEEQGYKDGYEDDKETPIMINPMMGGMIPIPNPYKDFNLWTGYTNFPITRNMLEQISHICGVETLNVITSYRLRLGVGKLFQPRDVIVSINKALNILTNSSGEQA